MSEDTHVIDSTALAVKARLRAGINIPPDVMYTDANLTKGAVGAIIGTLEKVLGGSDERYLVCGWLFGEDPSIPMGSKLLGDAHWYALHKWVGFWKDEENDEWKTATEFEGELLAVYSAAIRGVHDDGIDAQQLAGRDPLAVVDNAVGELGGKITKIVDTDDAPETQSKPVVVPKSLRTTLYGRRRLSKDAERRLLTELGYDPDEENVNF